MPPTPEVRARAVDVEYVRGLAQRMRDAAEEARLEGRADDYLRCHYGHAAVEAVVTLLEARIAFERRVAGEGPTPVVLHQPSVEELPSGLLQLDDSTDPEGCPVVAEEAPATGSGTTSE